jgi:hypothetical protein
MISSGSKSRLKEEKEEEVKHKIMWETGSKSRETHLRIVRFFRGLLSWGCLPLSMALGFFPLEIGEEMRSDG